MTDDQTIEIHDLNPVSEEKQNSVDEMETPETAIPEVEIKGNELESLRKELADQKDRYLRLFAEFDNFKKRSIREKIDLIKSASQEVVTELLVVLDDFERAMKLAEEQKNESIFPEGMRLVYAKLVSILQAKGLTPMESTGILFNPQFHEAITEFPSPNAETIGKVYDTVEKGYLLHDKIIRFAKVVVAK